MNDRLAGIVADASMLFDTVMGAVRHCQWSSTGHPAGSDPGASCCTGLSFAERAAKGGHHLTICAKEQVQVQAAAELADHLTRGSLMAGLLEIVTDPRLGAWKVPPRSEAV